MIGKRVLGLDWYLWEPGDYGFSLEDGHWIGISPNGQPASLGRHAVTEHEDGTITVSPSIEVWSRETKEQARLDGVYWHGYLEAGVWRQA